MRPSMGAAIVTAFFLATWASPAGYAQTAARPSGSTTRSRPSRESRSVTTRSRERPTGCTVVLVDGDATGGVSQRGGAPGTRETDILNPLNRVDTVNAVVLAGGSAFGLEAATGSCDGWRNAVSAVARRLRPGADRPAAILSISASAIRGIRPTADCGYRAAQAASGPPVSEGSVGAGAGATVGNCSGHAAGRMRRLLRRKRASAAPRSRCPTVWSSARSSLSTPSAMSSIPTTGRVVAGARQSLTGPSPTSARSSGTLRPLTHHAGREHDHRRRRDQRQAHESRSESRGADGRRWLCTGDLSVAHRRRRRYSLRARHRTLDGQRRRQRHRRAGRRRHSPSPSSARRPKRPASRESRQRARSRTARK